MYLDFPIFKLGISLLLRLERGKAMDGLVLPLEQAVYVQLQLCTTPSRGGVTTLSPPSPICLKEVSEGRDNSLQLAYWQTEFMLTYEGRGNYSFSSLPPLFSDG